MTPAELKQLRQSIGTQVEVARLLGITAATVTRYETGKISRPWYDRALERLAQLAGETAAQ